MNKVFKIKLLFIILPFLDVITALLTRNTGIRLTPGILLKSFLLLYFIIYITKNCVFHYSFLHHNIFYNNHNFF